ncbi:MAG: PQQ-binding-like beta-propeller repeat protein [Planctomycetota bacterium]|nr:PQQ-binding-like beta-propeller repeat protein [Planctomycetota bacterium]
MIRSRPRLVMVYFVLAVAVCPLSAQAADWPQWRCDAGRRGDASDPLPEHLTLRWLRQYPPLQPAFPSPRLQFDRGYEPIVMGQTLFLASSRNDSLTALDTQTGDEKWRFYADGPLRFAPVAWQDKVYFGADDGYLYCLHAADGALCWKFAAVPANRKLLGNGRLVSVWPVRGGPVLQDGILYFAAGVWPFEGIFIYALEAETGKVRWLNDRTGFLYGQQPHGTVALGGLTPQGYLLVHAGDLVVPCGTAYPARLDAATGKLKSFELPKAGRFPGGWFAAIHQAKRRGEESPTTEELVHDSGINSERHEDKVQTGEGQSDVRGRITVGGREYLFKDGLPGVEGEIHTMLAAAGQLFVVTVDGKLYCFGAGPAREAATPRPVSAKEHPADEWPEKVRRVVAATQARHGDALALGIGSGRMIRELALQTDLQIVAFETNAERLATARRQFDQTGLYGRRVSIGPGDALTAGLPPYFASLIVSEAPLPSGRAAQQALVQRVFPTLRPYGGHACFFASADQQPEFAAAVQDLKLPGAEVQRLDGLVCLTRTGAIPGTQNYTSNWASSLDEQVRAPLGVLWFGAECGLFKRAPQPMFVDGVMRAFDKAWQDYPQVKPPYALTAPVYMDAYTGRRLAPEEAAAADVRFPAVDRQAAQPNLYRPPSQKYAWSPAPPQTGERINPLTGQSEPRTFPKTYGCDGGFDYGYVYTMRSATAAFYDKRLESGTIHISGTRSGCTNSIIPANGLLNVPYYYQGCTCSYPLPSSLALVRLPPTHEQWSVWGRTSDDPVRQIQRLGLNFGAPGVRMTPAGTLWLDYPSVGGPSPVVALAIQPEKPEYFYHHALRIRGGRGWPWVAGSGVQGLTSLRLAGLKPGRYTLRLYFTEPETRGVGERVFSVTLQGQPLLRDLDIFAEVGGPRNVLVKQFQDVTCSETLELTFTARAGTPLLCGLELVAAGLPLDELPELATDEK